jgi:tRNA 5-methylaminomethyl-2-thiouridine biosynthesis bifunctional protein
VTDPAQGPAHALLPGCGLPQAWAGQDAWRILDTRFDQGLRFLATWQAWRLDSQRPRLLHYVALSGQPLAAAELLRAAELFPELQPLAQELAAQCWGLLPGFHRLTLAQGQVLLTLCVGETPALLREQQFAADAIVLDPAPDEPAWDRWACKALAHCCRRGTALTVTRPSPALQDSLAQCGFELAGQHGQFNPRWELKTTRTPPRPRAAPPGRCAVIGAGLAGASVAAALARRGWQVQVLDSAPAPAAGASGLPVGLVVPHVSADDSPRSRLSRAGVRLMLQQARQLLVQGQDWDLSGVLEHRVDGTPGLPRDWPATGRDWSRLTTVNGAWAQDMKPGVPSLWHAQAAWIKPAQLVQAWLAQPGVEFRGLAHVASLRRAHDEWLLLDDAGNTLARAGHVVLANACNLPHLLTGLQDTMPALRARIAHLPALHGMRGLLSWGLRQPGDEAALPPFPVNGLGGLIPSVPTGQGTAWYAGATYEAVAHSALSGAAHHQINHGKLHALLPAAAQALALDFVTGSVQAWGNTRCVSSDRLPLVGALDEGEAPSLWLSAALGSRGLSFSMLCAELLAAQLGAEPWPAEASLARFLHALRRPAPRAEDTQI